MGEGTTVLKGGRLAFEDRFQYHEWTFKQACISSLLQDSSPALLQHHSYRLPMLSVIPSSTIAGMFSLPTPNPYFLELSTTWENCRPKLCAILNILINQTQQIYLYRANKNKFCLSDEFCFVI